MKHPLSEVARGEVGLETLGSLWHQVYIIIYCFATSLFCGIPYPALSSPSSSTVSVNRIHGQRGKSVRDTLKGVSKQTTRTYHRNNQNPFCKYALTPNEGNSKQYDRARTL